MKQYAIRNTVKNMWVQNIVSGSEIVETNRDSEALLLEDREQAEELSRRLSIHRGESYQVTSIMAHQ